MYTKIEKLMKKMGLELKKIERTVSVLLQNIERLKK